MTKKYKCRVEYLESTGTQWIDTGFNVDTSTDEIKLYFQLNETQNYKWLFGEYDTNARLGLGSGDGANKRNFLYQQSATKVSDTQMYNTQHLFEINSNGGFLDGTKIRDYLSFASTSTIYLFNLNIDSASDYRCKSKIWGYRHKRNGVLILDLIPVLDNSGRPAMYDKVSGQLFYNEDSGDDFSYGRQIIPVEYLESTGTQYIDTGVKGKNNIDFDYKCIFTNLDGTAQCVGGNWSGAGSSTVSLYLGLIRTNGNFAYHYDGTSSPVVVMNTTVQDTPYSVQGHMWTGEQYMVINGTKSSVGTISSTFTSSLNMYLFGINNNGLSNPAYMKLYYCKIYDNGVLVRDFIPCIDENFVPFMFDKVQNTVYLNAGTGQFKFGPNVEKAWDSKKLRKKLALMLANLKKPRKYYCEVEYLESTGTQYIDTGLDYFADFEVGIQLRTSVSNKALGNGAFYCMQRYNQANPYWYFSTGTGASNSYITSTPITEHHIMKWKDNKIYSDGVLLTDFTKNSNTPNRMYLYSGDGGNKYPNMIYFCKLWNPDNGELVRDFIPVLDWNYVPCMFDRVTEQLFYNAGTGDFIAGREIHYVDYLESTGVEYIDTGIKFDGANTKIELKTYEDSLTRRHSICGDDGNFFYYFRGTGNWAVGYNNTAANIDSYMSIGDNIFVMDKNNVYVNGVLAKTYTASSSVSAYNALLFNRKTSLVDNGAVTMYYCKIWNNSALVRDYIPAIDENGVGYMFDRVSHTIFDNAGTGAFGYSGREVEYLESDGARAIVAGVTVDDTCGYDVKWMALNSNDTIILGTKGSGDSRWVLSGNNNPNVNISWNTSSGGIGLGLNKIQTAQMNYFNDRKRILNDTPLTDITQTLSANASTYSVGIFGGYWGASSISLYSTCRIYYAKITKGTELIRDFIPMVKDGSPCLFDKVGGLHYFGTGAGTFTRGKIVEPEYE